MLVLFLSTRNRKLAAALSAVLLVTGAGAAWAQPIPPCSSGVKKCSVTASQPIGSGTIWRSAFAGHSSSGNAAAGRSQRDSNEAGGRESM